MYKHNKEALFIEQTEMSSRTYFDPYFREKAMPEGVVKITKVTSANIPTKYMIQLGGVNAARNKIIYLVEFKCRKERDSRF